MDCETGEPASSNLEEHMQFFFLSLVAAVVLSLPCVCVCVCV